MTIKTSGLSANFDGTTLPAIFEKVAQQHPENVAVSDSHSFLTYRDLNARAARIAEVLVSLGVTKDSLVGLCLPRGCDLIVGLLSILKAGGAYVPLDPTYPQERLAHIARSGGLKLIVCNVDTAQCVQDLQELQAVDVNSGVHGSALAESSSGGVEFPPHISEDSLAYVIFTSGSTGLPKGAMIEHRNVVRLFSSTHKLFGFAATDVWCLFHSISFDFSVWEIWGALLFGGRLVIVPNDIARDPRSFYELLRRERVTILNQTPSSFRNLIAADSSHSVGGLALRQIIFGGERLDARQLAPWVDRHGLQHPCLVNMYGITEITVHVTYKLLEKDDIYKSGHQSLIGMPLPDLQIEICNASGNTLLPGTEGLIYIGGAGLSRGYLGQPELTSERFTYRTDATGRKALWYNSGDLGVEVSPNTYAYVGRADRQIKIRGYRIEPGEIEAVLRRNPRVRDAVVISAEFGEGDPRLVAYVLPKSATGHAEAAIVRELQAAAAESLPAYMVPSAFIVVDRIPTTVNGKQDVDALLVLLHQRLARANESTPNISKSIDEELHLIWTSVLGLDKTYQDAEFFDLGGTSFTLIHMLQRVNSKFQTDLRADIFSKGVTLASLVNAVTTSASA